MSNPESLLSDLSSALATLVERASRSVVSVDARCHRPGSGIIVGPDLVVTADHLIERDDVVVRVGEKQYAATIAGRDPASDIAALRVAGLGGSDPHRASEPQVGQVAVSIARTSGGGVSAGAGLINALIGPLRTGRGVVLNRLIRTDAAARPGTSGGAIVDAGGSVIAMTTSALVRGVVGIPMPHVLEIATALASNTPLKRAYLGVSVQPVKFPRPAPDGASGGLLVFGVAADGAADRAGLLVGDAIVAFNDARVLSAEDLHDRLAASMPGSTATLSVIRGGALQRIGITLGVRPSA